MAETPGGSVKDHAEEEPDTGTGHFCFVDGARYDGEWINNGGKKMRHGQGKFVDGPESYEGHWAHDSMHGQGKMCFASGAVYEGEFVKNQFYGQGSYTWSDGAVYTGGWRENKMHGEGTYKDSENVQWKGQFYNGKFNNGRSYVMLR
uniref:MORN repeat-containing protein 5 n=1 Tax=Fibrocapsa japonica TaxID=94617 RepID=A0A7S2V7Z2_9STRA|mmetsp:Transcript_7351/g.11064  ORF Transcript_7351/g.11064 Transcript_7351/m.11064 type:complete len:147 (+) Transcript_7351:52-492(+)